MVRLALALAAAKARVLKRRGQIDLRVPTDRRAEVLHRANGWQYYRRRDGETGPRTDLAMPSDRRGSTGNSALDLRSDRLVWTREPD